MSITVTFSAAERLRLGTRIKISGLAYGPQYIGGMTRHCKPGHETVMVVIKTEGSAAELKIEDRSERRRPARTPPAKRYGPARHGHRY